MCLHAENRASPFWRNTVTRITRINWWDENHLLIPWGLNADLNDKFCLRVFQLSELPRCEERPQIAV